MTNISQKRIDSLVILSPFTRNYHQKITCSELARQLRLPQKTVQRKVDQLLTLNLITYERNGRNKYFYLKKNALTLELLTSLETNQTILFLQQNPLLAHLLGELSLKTPLIIFGSYAIGKNNEHSDLDVVICGRKTKEVQQILLQFPLEINPHFITLKKLQQAIAQKNNLALEIVQKHIFIGKKEELITLFWNTFH